MFTIVLEFVSIQTYGKEKTEKNMSEKRKEYEWNEKTEKNRIKGENRKE